MVLALQVLEIATASPKLVVAVEEPGYPTIFDTYERAGYSLIGVDVDVHGAVPRSLDAALAAGAQAVLLTPRAHNPTGASWTRRRAADLADVVADHPGVLVIEDDQFAGIASTRPGSLLADTRLEERVVYIRSFSKSIARTCGSPLPWPVPSSVAAWPRRRPTPMVGAPAWRSEPWRSP